MAEMVLESSVLDSVNITLAKQGFHIDLCGPDSASHLPSYTQPGFQEAPNIQTTQTKANLPVTRLGFLKHNLKSQGDVVSNTASLIHMPLV